MERGGMRIRIAYFYVMKDVDARKTRLIAR
jgi:hypothetical protein